MPALAVGSSSCHSVAFSRVIRAGGIARRRTDAAILFVDQLIVGEPFLRRVAPELAAHALVHAFGERLREPIGQRLEHDARIVVVRLLEALEVRLDADARSDGERADVVAPARVLRRDEVGERSRATGPAACPSAGAGSAAACSTLRARLVRVDLDVVVIDAVRREQADHAARRQPALADDLLQHAPRIRVQIAGLLADDRIGEDVRKLAARTPRR